MENYYTDERVLLALEQSPEELMDILTFIKEVNFEIRDNLGFDVLWDSMSGKQCPHVGALLLTWMGYEGNLKKQKENFSDLLDRNDIEYREIGFQDPLIEYFPKIQEEIENMVPMHLARKKWIIMEPKNFKEAVMCLTTRRSKEIRKYYLHLEELVQLYGAYTSQFREKNLKDQIKERDDRIKERDERIKVNEDYTLLLKDLMIDDQKREMTQVIYISTSKNYARQNRFKVGGVESESKLISRLSTYNSRSAAGDEWFFSDIFMVADYHQIETRLKDIMGRFRDKKRKEIYVLHHTNLNYVVRYLCEHYNEEVDEVNAKLSEFISNLHPHHLRPIVLEPLTLHFFNATNLEEDGTVTNTAFQAGSQREFKELLKKYVERLDSTTTEITKKKVFDDLRVKKERNSKLPILKEVLGQLRPDIKLKFKM